MITQDQKEDAAANIRFAVEQLNKAIIEAAKLGIRIEDMREVDATCIDDRCPAIIYNPVIVWKETL